MFNAFIKKIFGTKHERQMKRMQPLIDRINGLEAKMKGLAEADFPKITADLRARLAKGEPLDDLTAEAFAAVRLTGARGAIEWLRINQPEVQPDGSVRFLGLPVLSLPRMSFPLSDQRKSGWLPPSVNTDNRSGVEFAMPWYWDIAPNRDATFTPTVLTRRGLALDSEFRYLEPRHSGRLRLHLLPGDRVIIPDIRMREVDKGDSKRHRFRRKGVPARFKLQVLRDDKPQSGKKYELDIEGHLLKGTLDGQGTATLKPRKLLTRKSARRCAHDRSYPQINSSGMVMARWVRSA